MIHKFKEDFYGQMLSVAMVGYIRPERGFESLGKILSCSLELTPTSHDLTDATTPCSLTRTHTHSVTLTHGCVFLPDELKAAIHSDIEEAKIKLDLPEHLKLKEHHFFKTSVSTTANQILNGHRL